MSESIHVFAALALSTSPIHGAIIYDNGPLNIVSAIAGSGITGSRIADDFALGTPATITGVRFWLNPGNAVAFGGIVSYGIYNDPGAHSAQCSRQGARVPRSISSPSAL